MVPLFLFCSPKTRTFPAEHKRFIVTGMQLTGLVAVVGFFWSIYKNNKVFKETHQLTYSQRKYDTVSFRREYVEGIIAPMVPVLSSTCHRPVSLCHGPLSIVCACVHCASVHLSIQGPTWLSGKVGPGFEPHWILWECPWARHFRAQPSTGETQESMNNVSCRRDMTEILLKAA